jgi:hypothetical protein
MSSGLTLTECRVKYGDGRETHRSSIGVNLRFPVSFSYFFHLPQNYFHLTAIKRVGFGDRASVVSR